jgi:hypothetical protein
MPLQFNNALGADLWGAFNTNVPATGVLELRTGAPPGPNNAATGTLIASYTLPTTPWAITNKQIALNALAEFAAAATGTLGYFRIRNAADTRRFEGTCGTSGADLNWDSVSVTSGQTLRIPTSVNFQLP